MEALLRIRTKDGNEILNNKIDVVQNKKTKAPKAKAKAKASKVPKGVSASTENGEFSKFKPIKTPNAPAPPLPWEDESMDDVGSVVNLDDDGKFETEDDLYTKQDREWNELMKEADVINDGALDDDACSDTHNDEASSEVSGDDTSSDINYDDNGDFDSTLDEEEGEVFYSTFRETKTLTKPAKVYSGISIDFDDSDW